jgi:ribosomal protein S27E
MMDDKSHVKLHHAYFWTCKTCGERNMEYDGPPENVVCELCRSDFVAMFTEENDQ